MLLRVAFLTLALGFGIVADAAPLPECGKVWSSLIPNGQHHYRAGEAYASYAARVARKRCQKDWTVLVYMAADNDLTPYAYWDLYEMEAGFASGRVAAGSTLKSDLVVELDTAGNRGVRRIHVFQSEKVYDPKLEKAEFDRRTEADIDSPVVKLLPEKGEPEARRLQAFLEWGMKEYPAKHYMVLVWGHGQGWAPAQLPARPSSSRYLSGAQLETGIPGPESEAGAGPFAGRKFGGLAFNQSRGTYLDTPALSTVLRNISRDLGRPIDVYGSDACLMQMAEVAYEVSPSVRYIVGSTQVQNFLGLPYRRLMYELNTGRFAGEDRSVGDEAFVVAKMIPRIFRASMTPQGLQGRYLKDAARSITLSAVSSSELQYQLAPALASLGQALEAYLMEEPLRGMDLQAVIQHAPTIQGGAQDIGVFLTLLKELLTKEAEESGQGKTLVARKLEGAVDLARDALLRAVLAQALGTRYADAESKAYLLGFRAFTVWLPVSPEDYHARFADFSSSSLYRAQSGAWGRWMSLLYQ